MCVCVCVSQIPIRDKAIERHKRKNPSQSRQAIRFHPLLKRDQYEALMRPGTESRDVTPAPNGYVPLAQTVPHYAMEPRGTTGHSESLVPASPFGATQSTLRTSGSQRLLSARSFSTLGHTRGSTLGLTKGSNFTDCTQFSRLSVASLENRKLREENQRLLAELSGLREGKSTNRSQASHGRRATSRARVADPGLAALIEKIRIKIYQKYSKLRDAFRSFDEDKSGMISGQELYTALVQLGCASEVDLAGGRLSEICRVCGQNTNGQINYNDFADRLKVIDTSTPLIDGPQRGFASAHQ